MQPKHLSSTDLARLVYRSLLWVWRDTRPNCLRVAGEHARAYDTAYWAYKHLCNRLKEKPAKLGTAERWDNPAIWGERTRRAVQAVVDKDAETSAWQAWAIRPL